MTRAAAADERRTSRAAAAPGSLSRNRNSVNAIALKRALVAGEHAAFLWGSRSALTRSSAVTLDALARFDERLSHLVFKLAERPGLAAHLLHDDQPALTPGLMFVTAIVALRGRVNQVFDDLLSRLEAEPELLSPLASALTWLDYPEVRDVINRLLVAAPVAHLQLGITASVAHRRDPGIALERALDGEAPALRASALETVGRLALSDLQHRVRVALADEDPACRFWAAWAAVRFGERAGIPVLGRFAAECGPFTRPACDMALRALEPDQALRAQARLLSIDPRLGVVAAGIVGDPSLVPWLLDAMQAPALARVAGAAVCSITGLDLRRHDLDANGPLGVAATEGPALERQMTDPPTNEGVPTNSFSDEPDDDLVWPDAPRLREWWSEHRHAFTPGTRYLAGVPVSPAAVVAILRTGNQQQRAAAALELALLHPETPLVDVSAPAHRQMGTANQSF